MPNVVQMLFRRSVATAKPETVVASSFGVAHTTLGPDFDALGMINAERVRELQYREAFYTCRVHDWKMFDFNGRTITPGKASGVQPLISTAAPSFYVPLDQRRPSTPYRLPRKIVNSFTAMLFGHGRWPQIRSNDPQTQDFAEALVKEAGIAAKFIRARGIGGRCGTVGLSWCFSDGEPRVTVHHGAHLHVIEWEDESERIPAHVVEIYQFPEDYTDSRGKRKRRMVWKRRDWTKTADVFFKSIEVGKQNPDRWSIDEEKSFEHDDGFAHFVWIENLPDDITGVDGVPDYAEAYEPMISLDTLNSVNVRGATLNLDPTLKFKMDREDLKGATVSKGSEHAIVTGKDGDAEYLELSGTSISAGSSLVESLRAQILETVECVVLDPDKATAAGSSSVALRIVYAPMLAKTDILREQYGGGIVRLLDQMTVSARKKLPDADGSEVVEVQVDEEGKEVEEPVEYFIDLPPRLEEKTDETGQVITIEHERNPGGGRLWLEWGPYFKPTTSDYQQAAAALSSATGGKAIMSQQSAVELNANVWDRDGSSEWNRLVSEQQSQWARQAEGMFPGAGGEVPPGGANGAPGGDQTDTNAATPPPESETTPEANVATAAPKIELAPTDLGKIITVNEARRSNGYGPIAKPGTSIPDPDGYLTIAEFTEKRKADAAAAAKINETAATTQIAIEAEAAKAEQAQPVAPAMTPPNNQPPEGS